MLGEEGEVVGEMDGEEHRVGVGENEEEVKLVESVRSMMMGGKGRLVGGMDVCDDGVWFVRGVEGALDCIVFLLLLKDE
ncbi:uncharacterized protein A4U43_C01F28390 [Asparagus officinalis]|uniref:Uncharacterized protein n=1 Tax=Asparagus officinalis TaxID=4686 RepID=A0A5P1FVA5_ASPOF|nr:uncharacterized protein A4U43_C01F28390 [Asparagus officinalis]